MNRSLKNSFFLIIYALLCPVAFSEDAPPAPQTFPAPQKYNVLFLMSDEHTFSALGCYGNPIIQTPSLDSMAKSGVMLEAYCQDPICVPARTAILTGKMPSNVNVFGNTIHSMPESVPTIADTFHKAGYDAIWTGKTHWGGRSGFDESKNDEIDKVFKGADKEKGVGRLPQQATVLDIPASDNLESIVANYAVNFLKNHKSSDKPFFYGASFIRPHFPYSIQKQYYDMYKDKVTLPKVTPEILSFLPKISQLERAKYGLQKMTDAQTLKTKAVYYGMVTFVDEQIGRILTALHESGLEDNTIVVYTADHGEMCGEHGLWYKNSFYEDSVHIPLLISCPKALPSGVHRYMPVQTMDLFPTLCELCGLTPPPGVEAESLVGLIRGTESEKKWYAFSENYREDSASRMIRSDRWKYCYFQNDCEQLFDMRMDPSETHNLVNDPQYADIVADLKKRALDGWKMQKESKSKGDKDKSKSKKSGGGEE
jgi:arylsulfatase A-like enzyme